MSVWGRIILPRLIDLVMRSKADAAERARLVPLAAGRVLEIGTARRSTFGITPRTSSTWSAWTRPGSSGASDSRASVPPSSEFPVHYVTASAEKLPLADRCVDTILTTWTLCSIPDVRSALAEMRRVLRPGGRLLFIEHGRSPDRSVHRWQERLTPLWARIAGGCQLNRPIDALLEAAGFRAITLDRGYGDGPRLMSYLHKGVAVAPG